MNIQRETFKKWIDECDNIVFFGGAGVSTESGVPDFRSVDGLYNQKYDYPPEEILSHTFFMRNPEAFYKFYRDKLIIKGVQPNACHRGLAKLEQMGKLKAVVTQNIDGLHQMAGSVNVLELHGAGSRNYCMDCGRFFTMDEWLDFPEVSGAPAGNDGCCGKREGYNLNGVPHCPCGGIIKPDIVLYEESLDYDTMVKSVEAIRAAEMLIIGGASLAVYPAAGMIDYFRGKHLVVINKVPSSRDRQADLCIAEPIGEVFAEVVGA